MDLTVSVSCVENGLHESRFRHEVEMYDTSKALPFSDLNSKGINRTSSNSSKSVIIIKGSSTVLLIFGSLHISGVEPYRHAQPAPVA
ncbi:hypothetical protein ES703_89031 [subsurface metagenome]